MGGPDECGRLVLRPGRQTVGPGGRRSHRPPRGHRRAGPVCSRVASRPGGMDGGQPRPRARRAAPAPSPAGQEAGALTSLHPCPCVATAREARRAGRRVRPTRASRSCGIVSRRTRVPRVFGQLAEELRKAGDCAEAIRVCREGVERSPTYPTLRLTLGRALLESGDLQAARTELETVLQAAPDNILAERFLGRVPRSPGRSRGRPRAVPQGAGPRSRRRAARRALARPARRRRSPGHGRR